MYDDTNAEQLDTLDPKLPNRSVDLEVLKADEEGRVLVLLHYTAQNSSYAGYIKSYIFVPGLVFGIATGRFVDMGLQNPHTRLLPFMIRLLLALGEGATVGDGKNVWPCVEIHEREFRLHALNSIILSHITSWRSVCEAIRRDRRRPTHRTWPARLLLCYKWL